MSKNNLKFKIVLKRYFSLKNILTSLVLIIPVIIFTVVFVYGLNKKWYDGLSVIALIYICLGLLIIVFEIAQFKTLTKLKKLFSVKKENNEELTSWEKAQLKILNIKDDEEEENIKKQKNKETFFFLSCVMIVLGIILLCISLPYFF